ncbi:hypothetical protein F5Y19DRAFT_479593 [Xylariaceae sp. FL1651]|nr:hypothetical protein F5Y19DRAFT_479593 [Xylariaceae sp. FL1651]
MASSSFNGRDQPLHSQQCLPAQSDETSGFSELEPDNSNSFFNDAYWPVESQLSNASDSALGDTTKSITGNSTGKPKFEEEEMPSLKDMKIAADGNFHCYWTACHHKYRTRRDLHKHLRTHIKPVLCPFKGCPLGRTAEQRDMERHVKTHNSAAWDHGSSALRDEFQCRDCKQTFTREDNWKRHLKKYGHRE